jgi:hypothetical protein
MSRSLKNGVIGKFGEVAENATFSRTSPSVEIRNEKYSPDFELANSLHPMQR